VQEKISKCAKTLSIDLIQNGFKLKLEKSSGITGTVGLEKREKQG
jgi:hypothetical protein